MWNKIKSIFNALTGLFARAAASAIGKAAEEIAPIAERIVRDVAANYPDASGREKFSIAKELIFDQVGPAVTAAAVNLAIELAHAAYNEIKG